MLQHSRAANQRSAVCLNGSSSLASSGHRRGRRSPRPAEQGVGPDDAAIRVVTDFTWESPVVIEPGCSIDEALRTMMRAGVRALLVMRDEAVIGLITSYDIQGERPLQFLRASNYLRHDEIEVGHIMTPWNRVVTIDWPLLGTMRVSELQTFLSATGTTHVVAVEESDQEYVVVRGLISRTRLERQLSHRREV